MKAIIALLFMVSAANAQLRNTLPALSGFAKTQAVSVPASGDIAFGAYQRGFYLTAFKEAEKRALNDKDPIAMVLLAELYQEGLGIPQDKLKAKQWYEQAANLGEVNAIYALGIIAVREKKQEKALGYFKEAAAKNHIAAHYNLGILYLSDDEITQDLKRAADHFEKAAHGGNADAQYAIAQMLINGRGREPNVQLALNWLEKAAAQGLTEAQIEFGIALVLGKGINKDEKRGAALLKKAAYKGNAVAQNRYSRLLATGKGVQANLLEAAKWHSIASLQGIQDQWLDQQTLKLDEQSRRQALTISSQWYKFSIQ